MSGSEILVGLGGVLLGALLTGAVDAATRWHERRLSKRAAARLIFGELHTVRTKLEGALHEESWSGLSPELSEDWLRYRDALSSGMSGRDFHRVAGAYNELRVLAPTGEEEPFDEERCKEALERMEEAERLVEAEGLSRHDRRWMEKQGHRLTR